MPLDSFLENSKKILSSIWSQLYPSNAVRPRVQVTSRRVENKEPRSEPPLDPQSSNISRKLHKWNATERCLSEDEASRLSDMAVQSRKVSKPGDANLQSTEQWRFLVVFSFLAIVRLHFALSNSYIHPDEHFQGPEVVVGMHLLSLMTDFVTGDLFGWQASLPWEFTHNNPVNSPIRSILPIWMVYGLPMRIIKMFYGSMTLVHPEA